MPTNRASTRSHRKKSIFTAKPVSFDDPSIQSAVLPHMREVYHISDSGRSPTASPTLTRSAPATGSGGPLAAASGSTAGEEHQRCCWHEVLTLPRLDLDTVTLKVQVQKLVISGTKLPDPLRPTRAPVRFQRNFQIPADVAVKSIRTTWLSEDHLQVFGMKRKRYDRKKFMKPKVKTKDGSIKRLTSYTGESDNDSEIEKLTLKRQSSVYQAESYYKTLHFPSDMTEVRPHLIDSNSKTVTFFLNTQSHNEKKTLVLPNDIDASTLTVRWVDNRRVCIYALKESPVDDGQLQSCTSPDVIHTSARKRALDSTFHLGSLDSDTSDSSSDEEHVIIGGNLSHEMDSTMRAELDKSLSTSKLHGGDAPDKTSSDSSATKPDTRSSLENKDTNPVKRALFSSQKMTLDFLHTAPSRVDHDIAKQTSSRPCLDANDDVIPSGRSFDVCLDVSGYLPHEITVKVTRGTVVVAGYHEESQGRETIEYQFRRRLDLESHGVDPGSLSVVYEEENRLLRLTAALVI